tara:strand:- start:185 stop:457 length:273 start_codon:yes stop_codon:yes gene_type:complete
MGLSLTKNQFNAANTETSSQREENTTGDVVATLCVLGLTTAICYSMIKAAANTATVRTTRTYRVSYDLSTDNNGHTTATPSTGESSIVVR